MSDQSVEKTYIVYKHTNKSNGKSYIGVSSQSIQSRSGSNGKNYKRNKYFYGAIQKYGWDGFPTKYSSAVCQKQLLYKQKSN